MQLLLNIGLDIKATTSLSAQVVREIVTANDFLISGQHFVQSDTEPTLVLRVTSLNGPTLTLANLHQVAVDLQQDCIAVYRPATRGGALVGPNHAKWGKFNPDFFFTLDGQRLGVAA